MTELTKTLTEKLSENAQKPIIKDIQLDTWFTGQDILDDIKQLQDFFQRQGMGYQDTLFLAFGNSALYVPLNQALWQLGMIAHPVSETTPAKELQKYYEAADYPAIIVESDKIEAFEKYAELTAHYLPLKTCPNLIILTKSGHLAPSKLPTETSLALILNTSGTTGKPKQVGLTHQQLLIGAKNSIASHPLTENDRVLVVMPMFHINAQNIIVNATLLSSGQLIIAPKFSASRFWTWIQDYRITWTSVVPTIVTILLKNETSRNTFKPISHLRFVRCGSAILTKSKEIAFQETFGVPILEGMGMTEASGQITLNPPTAIKQGSVGKPFKIDLAIVKDNQLTKQAMQTGEVALRGPQVITDYLQPSPSAFKDGWLLTGDIGHLDEDGYLYLEGRKKDFINRGGEKISPVIVEDVLAQLDFIKDVAVIPVADEVYGEVVAAAIILQNAVKSSAALEADIMAFAAEHLAKYCQPTQLYFMADFPRNPTGKLLRRQLIEEVHQLSLEKGK
ncbi:Acyl-CoA synthetase (AMP-forming)/AMP-acid ligase II [Streptococcus gallolyticus]|uniref:Acyl-CoA synthetase (AMP-forming)/AMP-acid ligase II n=1 Tax=Streptococcus gallolyticus TaxID=315405 RepID=A0A1I7G8V0_9STRE|nr:AMP-binding protein [Streptococcus gallolyticus]SFC53238.1 Acyl-CoA synthetase (AMP-forming)/AMP-acid ligase II [Streptococcus gallolyticus]SFU44858.1 Acyl-CoA synthetase (AMP-forming)/AMP-acid ligase II [Streptococcus gallolyticus]